MGRPILAAAAVQAAWTTLSVAALLLCGTAILGSVLGADPAFFSNVFNLLLEPPFSNSGTRSGPFLKFLVLLGHDVTGGAKRRFLLRAATANIIPAAAATPTPTAIPGNASGGFGGSETTPVSSIRAGSLT